MIQLQASVSKTRQLQRPDGGTETRTALMMISLVRILPGAQRWELLHCVAVLQTKAMRWANCQSNEGYRISKALFQNELRVRAGQSAPRKLENGRIKEVIL
jgi:hypothetical protein